MSNVAGTDRNPEQHASGEELRRVLEDAIDTLPENFRTVFVLRSVEDLSVAETASCLEIPEETVKTRLYRARGLLRDALVRRGEEALVDAFSFEAPRCNRVVENVLRRIRAGEG